MTDDEIVMVLRCAADVFITRGGLGAFVDPFDAFGVCLLDVNRRCVDFDIEPFFIRIGPRRNERMRDALLEAAARIEEGR